MPVSRSFSSGTRPRPERAWCARRSRAHELSGVAAAGDATTPSSSSGRPSRRARLRARRSARPEQSAPGSPPSRRVVPRPIVRERAQETADPAGEALWVVEPVLDVERAAGGAEYPRVTRSPQPALERLISATNRGHSRPTRAAAAAKVDRQLGAAALVGGRSANTSARARRSLFHMRVRVRPAAGAIAADRAHERVQDAAAKAPAPGSRDAIPESATSSTTSRIRALHLHRGAVTGLARRSIPGRC